MALHPSRKKWLIAAAALAPVAALAVIPATRQAAVAILAPSSAEAGSSAARLEAYLDERKLYVTLPDGQQKVYNIAIGTRSYPTPTGTFRIRRIIWNPSWVPPDSPWARKHRPRGPGDPQNPMKVAKIFFKEPDYYIHGTGHIESLGTAASHGCLRMHPDEVAELGAALMQAGGTSYDWDWVKRTLRVGSTRTVNLKQPITITIRRERPDPAPDPVPVPAATAADSARVDSTRADSTRLDSTTARPDSAAR